MQSTERFEKVNIDLLVPYARNARTHSKEQILQLRSSLREFGFVNPVIVDKDYNIIAGHGRILAAKAEDLSEIPCVFVEHLTEAQKKAYILADNRLALNAGWDEELLAIEFADLKELGFDVELTGFNTAEIEKMFAADAGEDTFDVDAELGKPAFSKLGDVWLLGKHRLVCGDCTDHAVFSLLMDGKKANLCVTDPPYSVGYSAKAGTIKNDNLSDEDFYKFLLAFYKNTFEAMEKDASIYVFHSDTQGFNFRKAFTEAGFYLSGVCVWAKQSLVLGRSPYQWRHEPILYGWRKDGKHNWYADRKQSTVWEFDRPSKNELHPTMKPIALCAYPITNSSMSNCIVLDPFGGSGSTLIACEQTNRICHTIELDEKYADVIVKRYIEQVGSDEGVFLLRDGVEINYADIEKEQQLAMP